MNNIIKIFILLIFATFTVACATSSDTKPDIVEINGCDTVIQKSQNIKTGVDANETLKVVAKLTASLEADANKIADLKTAQAGAGLKIKGS